MREIIPFAGNPLDRASNLRRDDAWLEQQLNAPASRFLPFSRLNVLAHEAEPSSLRWLDGTVRDRMEFDAPAPFLLGLHDGVAHFTVDVSSLPDPIATLGIDDAAFTDARRLATSLPVAEAGILAQARALHEWHARSGFCSRCGSETTVGAGGGMRKCSRCSAEHFPNPHPVVIMVVWRGDQCLLGRGKGWGTARYSALAGFMDNGETIEEAVAREVMEEVGLEVDEVVYHASQPWPFPSSLMIGCFARTTGETTTVDLEELEEARWFTRDELSRALESPESVDYGVPGRLAIAHHLIKAWCSQSA